MKILGLTRVRNEAAIMQDTLDHMATFCSEVIVYDDCSTDDTVKICNAHKIVKYVVSGGFWDPDREKAEHENRQVLFMEAKKLLKPSDWFVYMDADERIVYNWELLKDPTINYVRMKLFDFYITKADVNLNYKEREFVGVEYRLILMAFRLSACDGYHNPDQRECTVKGNGVNDGFVKHYGKAISVEQWNETCDYYSKHFPRYAEKWKKRIGKAIHVVSDFGTPLIKWTEAVKGDIGTKIH